MEGAVHEGLWIGFGVVVAALLVLDLGVLNRRSHQLSFREALTWSGCLVGIAMAFGVAILITAGTRAGLEYYTGYIIELSLSVDNLFVFIMIFEYFGVPAALRPRVLKWGIFGAMIMRGFMIAAGAMLLERFEFIIYVFGAILIFTGFKMFREQGFEVEPEKNPMVRLARRLFPVSDTYDGSRFFTRGVGGRVATPLFLVLLVVEWSDVVFAVDSIPAIFAITRDPFIVYSSNVFAVLGLRALFFVLSGMMERFRYLKPAVAMILVFVGVKMLLSHWVHINTGMSLAIVVSALTAGVLLSMLRPASTPHEDNPSTPPPVPRSPDP